MNHFEWSTHETVVVQLLDSGSPASELFFLNLVSVSWWTELHTSFWLVSPSVSSSLRPIIIQIYFCVGTSSSMSPSPSSLFSMATSSLTPSTTSWVSPTSLTPKVAALLTRYSAGDSGNWKGKFETRAVVFCRTRKKSFRFVQERDGNWKVKGQTSWRDSKALNSWML